MKSNYKARNNKIKQFIKPKTLNTMLTLSPTSIRPHPSHMPPLKKPSQCKSPASRCPATLQTLPRTKPAFTSPLSKPINHSKKQTSTFKRREPMKHLLRMRRHVSPQPLLVNLFPKTTAKRQKATLGQFSRGIKVRYSSGLEYLV